MVADRGGCGKDLSPFNESRYRELLEGLEAVEIYYSKLSEVIDFRIESEYFEKRFLNLENSIDTIDNISFTKIASFVNGRPYSSECFSENEGVRISKIGDVTNKKGGDFWGFVEFEEFEKQKGKLLKHGDILMTLTGDPPDIGKVNYVFKPTNSSWNQRVAKINVIDRQIIKSNESLYAILSSEYSRRQLERYSKGIRQRNLGNESLERLLIPKFTMMFQKQLEDLINSRFSLLNDSKKTYQQAEQLLLQEIGLANFTPRNSPPLEGWIPSKVEDGVVNSPPEGVWSQTKVGFNVKSFQESFGTSGRLDAEYYQVKYDDIEDKIKANKTLTIKEVFDFYTSPSPSGYQASGTKVVKTKNVRIPSVEFESITDYTENNALKIEKGDLLFASMGVGSLGRISYIHSINEEATIDGTLKLLRSKQSFYDQYFEVPTLLYLTSKLGQEMIYKHVIGSTGIISISKESIQNLCVPELTKNVRKKLTEKVLESIKLKKQSEHLLEVAKQAVEMAIEESEEVAMEWIKKEMK